jgi:hypothetical protein
MPENAKADEGKIVAAATDETDDDFDNMLAKLRAEDLAVITTTSRGDQTMRRRSSGSKASSASDSPTSVVPSSRPHSHDHFRRHDGRGVYQR